jgi:drug/metabolite transporter (DMT)-like permease
MNRNIKFVFPIVLAMIIWGGSWVCAKSISHNLHFQQLAFIRFVLTFLFLIPPVFIFRERLAIDRITAAKIFIGSLFYTLYSQAFFLGISLGAAHLGGVLVTSLVPIITFALTSVSSRKGLSFREATGLVIGLGGSLIILKIWAINIDELLISGNLFFIIGAVLWSGLTINSHRTQSKISIWIYSFYLNGFAMILQAFFVFPQGFHNMFPAEFSFWAFMIYLSLIATVFATSVYFYAAKNIGPHKASVFMFLVPLSAVVLSWVVLHEIPEISTLLGGMFSVAAVYLIHFTVSPDDIPGSPV